jgi:hypothetical protein
MKFSIRNVFDFLRSNSCIEFEITDRAAIKPLRLMESRPQSGKRISFNDQANPVVLVSSNEHPKKIAKKVQTLCKDRIAEYPEDQRRSAKISEDVARKET